MMLMIVGLVIFLGIHLLPTSPDIRNGLINRFGPGMYRAIFSLISLAGFVVIVFGYHKMQLHPGKNPVLWDPPTFMRHITLALMLPAMILLVAAYIPSRIRSAVKHPMLMAVKLWAVAHLLANGDVASILLFGSFLAYAVYDLISVKARGALGPLGAKQPSGIVNDLIVLIAGSALYFVVLYRLHEWLIGVPPLPALSG
ncbi:MAG: NnrU family protein [Hyphomicrobium sp.]|nr:NnrU family protein [Hyphomicrobium sp.]